MFMRTIIAAAALIAVSAGLAEAKVLKLGMGDPLDSDQGALAKRFAELVAEYSNGDITVKLFPSGQLGNETGMIQNARLGTLDFALVGIGNLTPFAKKLGALTMPYVIASHEDAVRITTGALGQRWNQIAREDAGVQVVGWTYSNFRYLTNSKRPVTTLEDLKGLKVRVPQNKLMLATYEAWGAAPIAMAWPEVFTALQQGVVDGQDNPYIVNYTMKFQEVQKYLTEVHYQYSLQPLLVGVRNYNKFTPEERAIIDRAGLEAQQYALMFQLTEANKAKQGMIAEGVQVLSIENEQLWEDIAKKEVWPQFYDDIGGKDSFDEVLKLLGKS